MHRVNRRSSLLPPTPSGAAVRSLLALALLAVVPRGARATPADPPVALTPPPEEFGGPGSGLDLVWTIANRTGVARSVTLELTCARSWRMSRPIPLVVPPGDSVRFSVAFSVPDTAAVGEVLLFGRVHPDGDATLLDSCASVLLVKSAPQAAVALEIASDLVRLEWSTGLRLGNLGIFELSRDGRGWHPEGASHADERGRVVFEDRSVTPGSTVEYRMRAMYGNLAMVSAVTTVHVPTLTPFAITGLRPNPAQTPLTVAFTLYERAAVRLEVYDLAGRRVLAGDLGALAPGPHLHTFEANAPLRSGVYELRLTSGAQSSSIRAVIAR